MINKTDMKELERQVELVKQIKNIDFANTQSICLTKFLQDLQHNPKNQPYNESITFLYHFVWFEPSAFSIKNLKIGIKQEIINAFCDILDILPRGTFKAKIASIILIEDRLNKFKKPDLAKIIIENFISDFDKFFDKDYHINNLYFAIDLGYKFQLLKKLNVIQVIKDVFEAHLKTSIQNINYNFISLYRALTQNDSFWTPQEHSVIIQQLYQASINKIDKLLHQNAPSLTEKELICCVLELIVFVVCHTKQGQYQPNEIYQQIIDLNLKFAEITDNDAIIFNCLLYARNIADKKQDNKLAKQINKQMQIQAKKMHEKQPIITIPLNNEQKQMLKQYEDILVELMSKNELNLFSICLHMSSFQIDFDNLRSQGVLIRELAITLEFDGDYLLSSVHQGVNDIFIDYNYYVKWYALFCRILKSYLLTKFYPTREYFYPLVYNNNIIPQGYEEITARMLYAGIHNDSMDFFIYLSASIEAILRNILDRCGISCIKTNKKDKTQEYVPLETMIADIKKNHLLEKNDIQELELIFCKNTGFNIRNRIAHSRLNENKFLAYTWLSDYLWCFMINFFIKYRLYIAKFDTQED